MSPNKCKKCGLVNAASDYDCRRCGSALEETRPTSGRVRREEAKRPSFLYTLLALTLLGAAGYYIIHGFENSYGQIQASEANRLAAQPKVTTTPFTSRSESDQQRAEPYKSAIANSPNLAISQKHNDDVKRLMGSTNTSR
jgi:hypothetical protein